MIPVPQQQHRNTAAAWAINNPILADGEVGLEIDTQRFKVGDGIRHWNALPYWFGLGIDVSAGGNTAGALALISSGTMFLAGGNNLTISQNNNSLTFSAVNQSAQTQDRFDATLAGNTTGVLALMSSGTVTFAGGNNITLSQAGNAVTLSGPNTVAQSVQTQNLIDLSLAGNTSGVLALVSSGTAILAGGNNVTLSQNGQSVTISAFNQSTQTQMTGLSAGISTQGNTSGTTGIISNQLLLVGGNNITLSQSVNGQSATLTISAPNAVGQTVQTQNCVDLSLSGNTSGVLALISSGTAILAGGNNITLSQNGQSVTISAFTQTVQTQSFSNTLGISNLGNTSGTSGVISGTGLQLLLAGGNNITLSQSLNGSSATITISGGAAGGGSNTLGMSNLGNTSGTTGVVSGSAIQYLLAGGNNVTLSQSLNGLSGTVTISAFNQTVQTQGLGSDTLGISNLGNTSGTSGVVSGSGIQLLLAGGNNITLSQSINGSSATLTISAPNAVAQTVQTQNLFDLTLAGNTSGTLALVSSGTLTLAGGNNITLSQVGNAVTISAFNQSVQTQSFSNTLGMSNIGNTSGTTGVVSGTGLQLLLAGGNNITLSQSLNGSSGTISISAFTQTVQTQGMVQSLNGSSSQISISAGNLISISNNASTINVINVLSSSAIAQAVSSASAAGTLSSRFALADHAHAGVFSAGVSNVGNTSGNTQVVPGQLVLAGGNNVTLSVGTAAGNLMTVTISAGAAAAQAFSAGMSTGGNTSGTTGLVGSQMIFMGGNNITLSQSVNGNSASLTISAFTQTVQTQNCVDMQITSAAGGATTGTTALISSGTYTLAAGNNITLSQAAGNAITISGPASVVVPIISYYAGMPYLMQTGTAPLVHASNSTGSMWIFPLCPPNDIFPGNMSVDTVIIRVSASHTNTTGTTQANTTTLAFGIYGLNNQTQLTRLFSGSTSWGSNAANANISSLYNGIRFLTIHSSKFDAQPTLSNTSYFGAIIFSAANTNSIGASSFGVLGALLPLQAATNSISQFSGFFNAAISTATSYQYDPVMFLGLRNTGGFSTLPPTVALSEMNFTNIAEGQIIPDVRFMNSGASGMLGII